MGGSFWKFAEARGVHGDGGCAWCVAWSCSGELLASCGEDCMVRVFAWEDEGGMGVLKAIAASKEGLFPRTVRSLCWSPDGRSIAVASFDATATILSLRGSNLVVVETLELHESEVKSLAYSSSGSLLATCSRDKNVYVWECGMDTDFECIAILHGHKQDVKCVRWHPRLELLASASYDDTIRLWREEMEDWYCCSKLSGHTSTVWSISFDEDGDRLASVSADRSLIVWRQSVAANAMTGSDPVWKVAWRETELHHKRAIYSVDWKGDKIVTGCGDDAIRIYQETAEVDVFMLLEVLVDAHHGDVNCVAWNPTQRDLFASCGDDGTVILWTDRPKSDT